MPKLRAYGALIAVVLVTLPWDQLAASDELWRNYTIEIQRELAAELIASKAFSQVLDSTPTAPPADALMVSGRITEVEKGSAAASWMVGLGAGRPHKTTEFELKDASGKSAGDVFGTQNLRGWRGHWCNPKTGHVETVPRHTEVAKSRMGWLRRSAALFRFRRLAAERLRWPSNNRWGPWAAGGCAP